VIKKSVTAGVKVELLHDEKIVTAGCEKRKVFVEVEQDYYRYYCSSVFIALYIRGLYGHNSDRLWVTKILRSAKYGVRSCLNIRGTILNGYRSKRLQFINALPSLSTDAGQTSV